MRRWGGENGECMWLQYSIGEKNTQSDMLTGQPAVVAIVNTELLKAKSAFERIKLSIHVPESRPRPAQ